jgi:hypothetical protein
MAHEAEYAAAVAGMHEHTPSPVARLIDGQIVETYCVNSPIRFLRDGETLKGTVVEVLTDTLYHVRRYVPDVGYEHYAVDASETVPF